MRIKDPQLRSERARALTRAEFTARGKAFRFPKGQSGNPDGQARLYHQCRKIAREASPEMMRGLVELARTAEDERVRAVCLIAVPDRAGVKPIDYDPAEEAANRKPTFDPSLYSFEELEQLHAAIMLLAKKQGLLPPEEGEETIEADEVRNRVGGYLPPPLTLKPSIPAKFEMRRVLYPF